MAVEAAGERIPISLVTGFLGSGKTTLIAALLRQPAMAGTAVIVTSAPDRDAISAPVTTPRRGIGHEDWMDRRWAHGRADGGAAAQGRLRRVDLEPDARQGRDARS